MNYDLFTTQYYPLEVEIGRNYNRFTSKKSYYNGVSIVKNKRYVIRKQDKRTKRRAEAPATPISEMISAIVGSLNCMVCMLNVLLSFVDNKVSLIKLI